MVEKSLTRTSWAFTIFMMNEQFTIPKYLMSRLSIHSEKLNKNETETLEAIFDWADTSLALVEILNLKEYKTNILYKKVEELNKLSNHTTGSHYDFEKEKLGNREGESITVQTTILSDLSSSVNLMAKALTKDNSNFGNFNQYNLKTDSSKLKLDEKKTIKSGRRSKRKVSTRSIEAENFINLTIDKIIEFNEQDITTQKEKFRVGVGVLKKLTHRGDNIIRRVLLRRKKELDEHHDKHNLSTNQNIKGRYAIPINQVIHIDIPRTLSRSSK